MNLEQLITEVYTKHQAKIQAEEESKRLKEQKEIEQAIAQFKAEFDLFMPSEWQQRLGIEFVLDKYFEGGVCAAFNYRGIKLAIAKYGGRWLLQKNQAYLFAEANQQEFIHRLLIALGEIREEIPADPEEVENVLATLNRCYIDVQLISESDTWKWLCDRTTTDPEMKTHLGDVLHYLGEAIGSLEDAA